MAEAIRVEDQVNRETLARLVQIREERYVSLEDMALRMGLMTASLAALEDGDVIPSSNLLHRYATAIDLRLVFTLTPLPD